jgi:hypothetical protein
MARLLTQVFSPPAQRLELIAGQLERTGALTVGTLAQLRQVVQVMNAGPARTSAETANMLAYAAGVFSRTRFRDAVLTLDHAAATMSSTAMASQIEELRAITDGLNRAAARLRRSSGQ